jgi:hypothetical protein
MAKLEWYDDLDTTMIGVAGGLSVLILIVLVLGVQSLYFAYNSLEFDQKVLAAPTTEANQILREQRARLDSYGWVDKESRRVKIPIDRAIRLQARDLAKES